MVRSLSQWTKTLSFPARLSPNRTSKESVVNVQPGSPGVSPTPSASSLPQGSDKTISPIPITEISQIPNLLAFGKHCHNCGKWMQRRALRKDVVCNLCNGKIFARNCKQMQLCSRCVECDNIILDNFNYCECCGLETNRQLRITKARTLSNLFPKNQAAPDSSVKSLAASTIQPDKSPDLFDDFQIYPDPESEKAIMGSVVYCIHHKEGCQWSDELRKLKAHLNTCKHDAVLCAAQCGAMIPRVLMQDHLRYTCPRRRANCEHCGKEFSGSALEEHQGNCGHEPVYCENKCGAKVQRRHTQQHIQQHCSKRLVPCRHCGQRYTQDTVSAHGAMCSRAPVPCPQRCSAAPARDELDAHLRDHCAAGSVLCTYRDAGCRFKGTRQALERHTEESSQQHLALVSALATRQARQLESLRAAVARLSVNYTGALVWRISDWAAKMAEAKCKDGVELVSPAFYTSQYGYKLQASLFLNGNGAGEGTHMSVYIKILPGEYDALLRWPFAHTVSFTLFDQSSSPDRACNIVESFVPDPTWKNFQRPSKEPDALGFGFPRFVSHEMLKKRNFVKDDVMFLRVKVDPSKIVAV